MNTNNWSISQGDYDRHSAVHPFKKKQQQYKYRSIVLQTTYVMAIVSSLSLLIVYLMH